MTRKLGRDLLPLLDNERSRKRRELLEATDQGLAKIARQVARRKKKPLKEGEIALKVGKVFGRYKVSKHYRYTIGDGIFQWARNEDSIKQEARLDGIYVIRTSEPRERLQPKIRCAAISVCLKSSERSAA